MKLFPDSAFVEFNHNHDPKNGEFAAGSALAFVAEFMPKRAASNELSKWVSGEHGRWTSSMEDRHLKFDIQKIPASGLRFLVNPATGAMIIGAGDDNPGGWGTAHAIEYGLVQSTNKLGTLPVHEDDFIKGWVYGPSANASKGLISVYHKYYKDHGQAYDAYANVMQRFVAHGATKDTVVQGLSSAVGAEFEHSLPLKRAYPFLFKKRKVQEGWYPDSAFTGGPVQ